MMVPPRQWSTEGESWARIMLSGNMGIQILCKIAYISITSFTFNVNFVFFMQGKHFSKLLDHWWALFVSLCKVHTFCNP